MVRDVPVAGDEKEREEAGAGENAGVEMALQEVVEDQGGKVEGPDAQAAPDVKGSKVDSARLIFFALEQLGNEVGAEQEEEADAKRAGDAEGAEDAIRDIKTVMKEDKKEGEEAKDI
jgi:hypothetical protein